MTQDYPKPITPPPELVQQWRKSGPADAAVNNAYERHIATQAAQWGADQELEACCALIEQKGFLPSSLLRTSRRPKPPSLKEQALKALSRRSTFTLDSDRDIIRRALEQLDD